MDGEIEALIENLAKGGIKDLLANEDVKRELVGQLQTFGVPWPGLVYFLISKAANGSTRFCGGLLKSHLAGLVETHPRLQGLLKRLATLERGGRDREAFKDQLLDAINQGTKIDLTDVRVDAATDTKMLMAIYSSEALQNIGLTLADNQTKLLAELRATVQQMLQGQVEPDPRWPEPAGTPEKLTPAQRIQYTSGLDGFTGRARELDFLQQFVGDLSMAGPQHSFRWTLMTADGGEGKTRLAHHFTTQVLDQKIWDTGLMTRDRLESFDKADKWRPRQPTFLVIDYAQTVTDHLKRLLQAFTLAAREYDFPVRLLLLERQGDETWTDQIVPAGSMQATIDQHCFPGRIIWPARGERGWRVDPLGLGEIVGLMAARLKSSELAVPSDEQLISALRRVDNRSMKTKTPTGDKSDYPIPRALFGLATADALIQLQQDNPSTNVPELIDALDRDDVLAGIVLREQVQVWQPHTDQRGDLDRYQNLLALATICDGFGKAELDDREPDFGSAASQLPEWSPEFNDDLYLAMGGGTSLQPDILGEFFVLHRLADGGSWNDRRVIDFLLGSMKHGGDNAAIFFLRARRDFPEKFHHLKLLEIMTNCRNSDAAVPLSILGFALISDSASLGDWDGVNTIFSAFDALRQEFPGNAEIALEEAKTVTNISNHAGEQALWDRVDDAVSRVAALRQEFPGNAEIALREAETATNICGRAGEQALWDRVDDAVSRVAALRQEFPGNAEIALEEAKTATNISNHAGEQALWDRVDDAVSRVSALRQEFPGNAEIALREAMIATNISNRAGEQALWDRVDDAVSRVGALRQEFPGNAEIALREAMIATNISSDAGEQALWDRVDDAVSRVSALRQEFPGNAEIALREAMIATNISSDAGEQALWDRVDDAVSRVSALRQEFPGNAEIALEEAKTAMNISNRAGEQALWDRVDDAVSRVGALRQEFPGNAEIALREAMIATNICVHAQRQTNWARYAAGLRGSYAMIGNGFGGLVLTGASTVSDVFVHFLGTMVLKRIVTVKADKDVIAWLQNPHMALNNKSPLDVINDGELDAVLSLIEQQADDASILR